MSSMFNSLRSPTVFSIQDEKTRLTRLVEYCSSLMVLNQLSNTLKITSASLKSASSTEKKLEMQLFCAEIYGELCIQCIRLGKNSSAQSSFEQLNKICALIMEGDNLMTETFKEDDFACLSHIEISINTQKTAGLSVKPHPALVEELRASIQTLSSHRPQQ